MTTNALLCRECGAPVAEGIEKQRFTCSHCGSETPLDGKARSRLARHRFRVHRAEQKARCMLREELMARLLPSLVFRVRLLLYGSLGILFLLVPFLTLFGALLLFAGDQGSNAAPIIGIALLCVGGLIAVFVVPLGFYLAFRQASQTDRKAARAARTAEGYAQSTIAAPCKYCGGFAQVVVIGSRFASACPWCGSQLVSENSDAARAAVHALMAAKERSADSSVRRARLEAGFQPRDRFKLQLPGFELSGGIYQGSRLGDDVWVGIEVTDHGVHRRVEVDRETGLDGAVWFIRREVLSLHAKISASCGSSSPDVEVVLPNVSTTFAVYADPVVDAAALAAQPRVWELLGTLNSKESLHFDGGGGSCWHLGGSAIGVAHRQESVDRANGLAAAVMSLGGSSE